MRARLEVAHVALRVQSPLEPLLALVVDVRLWVPLVAVVHLVVHEEQAAYKEAHHRQQHQKRARVHFAWGLPISLFTCGKSACYTAHEWCEVPHRGKHPRETRKDG